MAITLELPRDVERHLERSWGELPRRALESLALEAYREGHLSAGKVGEMLGLSFWATEAFLKEHHALLHYDEEDLKQDLSTLRALRSQ